MKWLINQSTRSKLLIGFGLLIVFLAGVTGTAYRGIHGITDDFTIAISLVELRSGQNRNRANILEMMTTTNRAEQEVLMQDIKVRATQMDEDLLLVRELGASVPNLTRQIDELKNEMADYRTTRDGQFILILAGKNDEARQVGNSVQEQRYEKIRKLALDLGNGAIKRAGQTVARSVRLFLLIGGLAVVAAIVMALLLNRLIAHPLRKLAGVAERIAAGDLTANVAAEERDDEVGVLARNFQRMTQWLQTTAGVAGKVSGGDLRVQVTPQSERDVLGAAFAEMVANLRALTSEIAEAVNVLGSASSEIVASTSQLAASSTETATAVTETTTTVEEVRQTAQVASQKAKSVSDSAQKSAQISQAGRKSTDETVESMKRIHQQMSSIADSMVRLSEQTQAIGQIIAAVDDLAAQSNLLAVNAAIEAAKAGEQGKGFTVVAQEVKSLAEQSKQATAQVRTILSDIQKATSAAVMATEQGTKAVEAGVKQSAQAGESIQALTSSVAESAQAATQIAASSQQQLIGVDQVASAMESIKQATAQNVASAKQMETSARNLNDVGRKLKQLIERYKV